MNFDFPFAVEASYAQIAQILSRDMQTSILETRNLLNLQQFPQMMEAMVQASRIAIFTTAGNLSFASNFRFQMLEIGRDVLVPVDEYEQRCLAASLGKQDFALLITFGGRSMMCRPIAKLLYDNRVPLLLLSSPDLRKEDWHAKWQLYLAASENHYRKISSFATRQSLLYLLDLLYCGYFQMNYQENTRFKLDNYGRLTGQ